MRTLARGNVRMCTFMFFEVDNLHINKLAPVPVDLSKLSDIVKNDVLKKTDDDKLVAKLNSIDTSGLVSRTKYDQDKSELENKYPDTSGLVKKADCNTKITDIEDKIPHVSNLVTKTALTTVGNKIPDVSNLVKTTDYDIKAREIENKLNNHNHDKYSTISEFNNLAVDVFNARLSQANLVTKTIFDNTVSNLNSKIAKNKPENESIENELKKLKTFDLGDFIGKSYFEEDCAQNYLVFQPIKRHFKLIANSKLFSSWQSKGLSEETIKPPAIYDNSLNRLIDYYGSKVRVKFNNGCLKQLNKLTYDYDRKVNIYIVYELDASKSNDSDLRLKHCLFRDITLRKRAGIEKNGYSGYGIEFDRRSSFSFPGDGFGQNVLIFGVDKSSFDNIDSEKKTH